jgi:hypothetical protein
MLDATAIAVNWGGTRPNQVRSGLCPSAAACKLMYDGAR